VLVVSNELVQQILVLWELLRMRRNFGSLVEHNSMNMFNKEVISKAHHGVCLQLLLVHHDGRAITTK
jgi:hypothetical protein